MTGFEVWRKAWKEEATRLDQGGWVGKVDTRLCEMVVATVKHDGGIVLY